MNEEEIFDLEEIHETRETIAMNSKDNNNSIKIVQREKTFSILKKKKELLYGVTPFRWF